MRTNDLSDATLPTQLQAAYAGARQLAGPHAPIVLLHIGAEHTVLAVGHAAEPSDVHMLPLGAERTAREHFRTTPPTPLAMENAIATVEDHVMPLRKKLPLAARLYSQDAALREIAGLAEGPQAAVLSLDAMERCFDRLSRVVTGTPAAHMGLPETAAFAATLLILREFMHHLQFAQLELFSA